MSIPKTLPLNAAALDMLRIRTWQHVLNERLKLGHFKVPIHLAFGYEALAVSLVGCLGKHDQVILHHRNIAYQLAMAKSLLPVLDEFLGRPTGAAGGVLGSMNLAMKGTPVAYTTSILGNGLPVATGVALHQKLQSTAGTTFVVIGDGGIEEGSCYESLVFAKTQGIPLTVIMENNDQSMSSSILQRRCPIDWSALTNSLGIPYRSATGTSHAECSISLQEARRLCLETSSPVFVEVRLHAFNQHAGPSPGWKGDVKNICLSEGPCIKPFDRDPLWDADPGRMAQLQTLFLECLTKIDEETLSQVAKTTAS